MKLKPILTALLLFAGLIGPLPLHADLVSHWTFDGNLDDSGPSGNEGVFFGDIAPIFADGYDQTIGGAVQFDGADDYVEVIQSGGLPIYFHPAYSVAAWVKALPQNDRRVYSESSSINNAPLFTIGTESTGATGQVDIFIRTDTNATILNHRLSAGTAFDDTWHHIAWVDSNGQAALYIDGVRDPTDFNYTKPVLSLDTVTSGAVVRASRAPPPCCFLLGAVDDLRVYDHALTEQEIADLVQKDTCPPAGDTHCGSMVVTAPPENRPGMYSVTADATDDSVDTISYTFRADNGAGTMLQVGPQPIGAADFNLTAGNWTITVTVDDDPLCSDVAPDAVCSTPVVVSCPSAGDTHCGSLGVIATEGNAPGTFYFEVENATDDTGEPILYSFRAENQNGLEPPRLVGPLDAIPTTFFTLEAGTWTITATVDDDTVCPDAAPDASCSTQITVTKGPPSLVSRFTLDGTLEDSGPAANDATFVGDLAPLYADGFDGTIGGAVSLDGIDDFIDVPQTRNLPIYAQRSYSVALWVNGGPQADNRVYSEGSTLSNTPLFNIGTDNTGATGNVDLFIRGNNNLTFVNHRHSQRPAFDNTWHHIAWVDDDGRAALYVDGVRDATDFDYPRTAMSFDTTSLGAIKRAVASNFFTGMLDDVRVYNYALSATEVEALVPEPPGCPGVGDTHCGGLSVQGPPGDLSGTWTATAFGSTDDGADAIIYTFTAVRADGKHLQFGPQPDPTADFQLKGGTWTISATADDDLSCRDRAGDATCSTQITVIAPDPVLLSRWEFAGDLLDTQPAANHGTFAGGLDPVFVDDRAGAPGAAIAFDGLDDYVLATGNPTGGLPIYNQDAYSIALWVKGPPQPDRRVYSESTDLDTAVLFNIGTQNLGTTGQVDLFIRGPGNQAIMNHVQSTGIAFDDTWHHIAWVDEDGAAVLYIDGERDPTDFRYLKSNLPVTMTTIGGILRATPCCWFNGSLDDVRVYNFALTEAQVQAIFSGETDEPFFRRGDANASGDLNITDGVFVLNYLFIGGPTPTCLDAADSDDNGQLNITDGVRILNFLFLGGPEPPAPGTSNCGPDPESDDLEACVYGSC